MIRTSENAIDDWITSAKQNLGHWEPDIFFEELRTPLRDAYASTFRCPETALELIRNKLESAKPRAAKPFHIMNIEAPGGCWELGTQISPDLTKFTAPNGHNIITDTYRFVYLLWHAIVVDEHDVVRHQCNNRACIRPDHMLLGTQAQNVLDEDRRKYAGHTSQGRGQALDAQVKKHLQRRPDPFVLEPLALDETTNASDEWDWTK